MKLDKLDMRVSVGLLAASVAVAVACLMLKWYESGIESGDMPAAREERAADRKPKRTSDVPKVAKKSPPADALARRKPKKVAAKKNLPADALAERESKKEEAKPEEKPAQEEQAAQEKTNDNPFPRYLDMFKNNPEALAAEFQKEAEKEHAALAKVREHAIEELKLNAEQVAVFEKALDDLRDQVTRINGEWAELIASGQLNDDDDGSILTSNRLLGQRFVAAREKAMRETSEKLYDQLVLDGVSDAKKQAWLFIAAHRTATSIECLEPNLAVYDKLYKNYGMGEGLFSWCSRQRQQQGKK